MADVAFGEISSYPQPESGALRRPVERPGAILSSMKPAAALGTLAVVVATLTAAASMWVALPVAGAGDGTPKVVPARHVHSMSGMNMAGMKMPMR